MLSQFSVDGSSAIVTGASSGIGEAIAANFADDGVDVVINSRAQERVDAAAERIRENDPDGEVLPIECDVRDREAVFDLVDTTVSEFGGLDVMVNNAAGLFSAPFEELSANAWKTIVDIDLHGVFHGTQAAGEVMREGDGGYVLNLSSVASLPGGSPGSAHYGAAKAGVNNLTESLAREWAEYGIRVNNIAPGLVGTEFQLELNDMDEEELGPREDTTRRMGRVEEVADVAQFLCSPAASFISGETIVVALAPGRWGE